jgi:hypothetical protein
MGSSTAYEIAIQRTWASIIGVASTAVGILTFCSIVRIPTLDAVIHMITSAIFIVGAWTNKGQYVGRTNRWLGVFYIVFGATGVNCAHIIVGIVSILIGLLIKPRCTAICYLARDYSRRFR